MEPTRILIVDDDPEARAAVAAAVRLGGYEICEASDGLEGLAQLERLNPAVVLTDLRMPGLDGLSLLRRARELGHPARFLVLTAHGSVENAVEAIRCGAEDFLMKPLDVDATLTQIEKVLQKRPSPPEGAPAPAVGSSHADFPGIIGDSAELRSVLEVVKHTAGTKATVLVLGESGTGKELIAQALHEHSPRSHKPFIKLNCAALPDSLLESELFGHERGSFTGAVGRKIGRFERADGGTLFLDEIGDISPSMQVKLLRALQQQEFERVGGTETVKVDVRMIAATNRDLEAEVAAGRFRQDLYYRLNVVSLMVPPLRQRKSDIQALVQHYVRRFSEAYRRDVEGLTPGALNAVLMYDWPGNVRELANAIERAVVLCRSRWLAVEDLPPAVQSTSRLSKSLGNLQSPLVPGASLYDVERYTILRTFQAMNGSTSRTAEVLGVSVRKVQYKLREYAESEHLVLQSDGGGAASNAPDEPQDNAANESE